MRSTKYAAILLVAIIVVIGLALFILGFQPDQLPGHRPQTALAATQQSSGVDERLEDLRTARGNARQPIDPNNLEDLERAIDVEPEYKGDERHYYCLIFDDDQKQIMWMVFDGSMLYVDRNFNGDLTDEDEAFPTSKDDDKSMLRSVGKINFMTGSGQKAALEFTFPGFRIPGSDPNEYPVRIQVRYRGATFSAWGDQTGEVANAKSPSDAPILRINGPLQMGFEVPANYAVQRTENGDFKVNAGVGTYGLGNGSFVHLKYWNDVIPDDVFPHAQVEFPAEDKSKPNVFAKLKLNERCCSSRLYGAVSATGIAKSGTLKIKLTYNDWTEANVQPFTIEYPIPPSKNQK